MAANFADAEAQGPKAYADQFLVEHADLDLETAKADAFISVAEFCDALTNHV